MDKDKILKITKKHAPTILKTENILGMIEAMHMKAIKDLNMTPEERERALYEELKKKYEKEV